MAKNEDSIIVGSENNGPAPDPADARNLPVYECRTIACDVVPELNDTVWAGANEIILSNTATGGKTRQSTAVRAFYNSARNSLMCRFICEDDGILCTMTKRDDPIYEEDVLEVFISPDMNKYKYIELEASPAGVLFDAVITYRKPRDISAELEWDLEGLTVDTRFNENLRQLTSVWEIPLAGWAAKPACGDTWLINFYRIDHDLNSGEIELQAWSHTGEPNFHVPDRFGVLRFV